MSRVMVLAPYVVITAAHLVCELLPGTTADTLSDVTQVLLVPALALWLTLAPGGAATRRLLRLVGIALVFCWLGDTIPRFLHGDAAFGAMIGSFAVAQVFFVAAFWPWRARSVLHRRRLLLVPYVVVLVVLLIACVPAADAMAPAVIVYGCVLSAMGITATGLNRWTWIGGAVFVVSDGLIAAEAFDVWTQPGHGFWVMITYCAALAFLVRGVIGLDSVHDSELDRPAADPRAHVAG